MRSSEDEIYGIPFNEDGETFLVLASPTELKIFTHKGTFIYDVFLTKLELRNNATFFR